MTQPYVGEIRMFGGNFAPSNWAFCNGQTMAISQFNTLFALIGTTYGGNGQTTFNLPNLQGQLGVGMGQGGGLSNYVLGQVGGAETVTLTTTQMAAHNHSLNASKTTATFAYPNSPTANLTGAAPTSPVAAAALYTNPGSPSPQIGNLDPRTVGTSGGSAPHPNMMPSLCVSFIISLYGIFPSQS
jgi:microcystin-dependent protein